MADCKYVLYVSNVGITTQKNVDDYEDIPAWKRSVFLRDQIQSGSTRRRRFSIDFNTVVRASDTNLILQVY